ncbi:hypothetical protein D3C81_1412060 [compost metagenome]
MCSPQVAAFLEGAGHPFVYPGRGMNGIGDADNRRSAGNLFPHFVSGIGVQLGNGIGDTRQAQAGNGHVERFTADPLHLVTG